MAHGGSNTHPPQLTAARIGHELWCIGGVLTISASYALYGAGGLAAHTLLFGVGSVGLDYVVSPTMGRNLAKLEDHGYNNCTMVLLMLANLVASNILVVTMIIGFGCFDAKWRDVGWTTVAAVVSNLLLSELTFTAGHWALHQTARGGHWHTLHHACRPCSWSTNLLFHPVDLAVEFSGPFLALACSHCLLFNDVAALLVSVHLLHLWYALDHSENFRLSHYRHHLYVDSTYTIYCGHTVPTFQPDTVKPLLRLAKVPGGRKAT